MVLRHARALAACLAVLTVSATLAGCGDDSPTIGQRAGGSAALEVPAEYPTIQAAVDAAKDGELILVAAGVYKEGVTVETPNLTIRGLDRATVVVDGEFQRENGIKVVSNGVAVENLTVRNHLQNGVFFTGSYSEDVAKNQVLAGYRASYVTAYNNGLYGVYAFNATKGQIDHSYGSGHPDSAFYVGQCNPCDALITDVVAERNMLGYSGTNSTGVTVVRSVFRNNRSGIAPNSLNSEKLAPNAGTVVVGNLVENNSESNAPNNKSFAVAYGVGIAFAGISNSTAQRNLVRGHVNAGIAIVDLPDGFKPEKNVVSENTLTDNTIDLAYLTVNFASVAFGNCYSGNVGVGGAALSEFPERLQARLTCPVPSEEDLGDLSPILARLTAAPPDIDYKTLPAPPDQPGMADPASAPVRPASAGPASVDLAAIPTPTGV